MNEPTQTDPNVDAKCLKCDEPTIPEFSFCRRHSIEICDGLVAKGLMVREETSSGLTYRIPDHVRSIIDEFGIEDGSTLEDFKSSLLQPSKSRHSAMIKLAAVILWVVLFVIIAIIDRASRSPS